MGEEGREDKESEEERGVKDHEGEQVRRGGDGEKLNI